MLRRFRDIFSIVLRLLIRTILNLALQEIEKVPDVSRNSARCFVGANRGTVGCVWFLYREYGATLLVGAWQRKSNRINS